MIGTAINPTQFEERDCAVSNLITSQFNTLTTENVMKSALIPPAWNHYNFEPSDR